MRSNRLSRRHFLASSLIVSGSALGFADEPKPEIPSYNHMTDDEEIALGRDAARGIEKEKKLNFVEDPSIRNYANRLLMNITRASRRPNLPYSINIIDTKEINAFTLPGGFVYVNRGLLEWTGSESELAAALCHEVGHVVAHHGANAISRYDTADSLLTEASRVLTGDDLPAHIIEQIGGPVAFLALLKYSRTQELEADLLGYYNLQRAGWSATGMLDLFRHLGQNGDEPFLTLASSHPAAADRESQIREEMNQFPPTAGLVRQSESFLAMQADLKRLPKPRVREQPFSN